MRRIDLIKSESFHIHHLEGHIQSMFLVEYSDRLLLLDGGCKCDSKTLRDYISKQMNRQLDDLKLCVVTHMHPDHAGGAQSLRSYTGCKIAAGPGLNDWYKGFGGFLQHKVDTYLAWWVSRKQNRQNRRIRYPRKLFADFRLNDSQPVPGFPDWLMIHTPGHTSHDVCLFHPESGFFYAGDLLVRIKDKFLPPFPVTLPDVMCQSLKRVEGLSIHTMLLAHGGPVCMQGEPFSFNAICEKLHHPKKFLFRLAKMGTNLSSEMRKAKKRKHDYH